MSWKRRPSHIRKLAISTTLTVAIFLGLVFCGIFSYSRNVAEADKKSELANAREALLEDRPKDPDPFEEDETKFPDLPELQEYNQEVVGTVYYDGNAVDHTGSDLLPWCDGYRIAQGFVLYGFDVDEWHVVVGVPRADSERALQRLADVLALVWVLLVGVVAVVTVTAARGVFKPLKKLAEEANSIGGEDLSKRLALEDDAEFGEVIEHLNAMLERLQKSADRERQFSSDVAHELRTPLAILRTQIETTLLRERPVENYVDSLEGMLPEIDRVSSILSSLLETARDLGFPPPPINVEPIVSYIGERWKSRFEEAGQILVVRTAPTQMSILPTELEIVLGNLLENSLRFSSAGSTTRVELDPGKLVVADQGSGIPADLAEKIFDRFVRGEASRNRETGGLGIGLALVKKIVGARRGRIDYENLAPGTCFTLQFPSPNP